MNRMDSASIITIDINSAFWTCRIKSSNLDLKQFLKEFNDFDQILRKTDHIWAQIFKLNEVVSVEHIKIVLSRVLDVFHQVINISNHPNMEFLLYLSGQRQIKRALEISGIKSQEDTVEIGFIVFGDRSKLEKLFPTIQEFLSKFTIEPIVSRSKAELTNLLQKHCNLNKSLRILESYNYNTEKIATYEDLMELIPSSVVEQIIIDIVNEQMIKVQISNFKGEK